MELNRTTFRRLVQTYLLLMVLTLATAVYEAFRPAWESFSADFDDLVERHFGVPQEHWFAAAGVACSISLLWGLASAVGLLSFRRWARFGFWASFLLFSPVLMVPGFYPYYMTPWGDLLAISASAAFGAILLLAYSREHGEMWFNNSAEARTEG